MSDLQRHDQLVVAQYADDTIRAYHNRLEMTTRRVVPEMLFTMDQRPEDPFTPAQLLCMAAAEYLVRAEPLPLDLNW